MAIDPMVLRKLAAEKAKKGSPPAGTAASDQERSEVPTGFAAAAMAARDRLRK